MSKKVPLGVSIFILSVGTVYLNGQFLSQPSADKVVVKTNIWGESETIPFSEVSENQYYTLDSGIAGVDVRELAYQKKHIDIDQVEQQYQELAKFTMTHVVDQSAPSLVVQYNQLKDSYISREGADVNPQGYPLREKIDPSMLEVMQEFRQTFAQTVQLLVQQNLQPMFTDKTFNVLDMRNRSAENGINAPLAPNQVRIAYDNSSVPYIVIEGLSFSEASQIRGNAQILSQGWSNIERVVPVSVNMTDSAFETNTIEVYSKPSATNASGFSHLLDGTGIVIGIVDT
ncbi:MAG: hypothetical protein R3A45_13485, partial [Bdellovibrionota bacterium]